MDLAPPSSPGTDQAAAYRGEPRPVWETMHAPIDPHRADPSA